MKRNNLRKILWYLILALPILAYLFAMLSGINTTFSDVCSQFALPVNDSIVGSTLVDIFGANGILPLVTANFMAYFNYFVGVELIHIAIDILLFLPKFCQRAFERLDKEHDS